MKFAFVEQHRSTFDVWKMCKLLKVSRSGYHAWRKRNPSARQRKNKEVLSEIQAIHQRSRGSYGSPRITQVLQQTGWQVNTKRVARLMRQAGIRSCYRRRRGVKTTDSTHAYPVAPNLLQRNFQADQPNQKWVSDISYISTSEGWLYLCVILDLYSRAIVGWAMRTDLKAELALSALEMAWQGRKPTAGLLFHSDRGVQYASHEFQHQLQAKGITPSMSRKGNCWDNACMESFFGTLKQEGGDYFATIPQAQRCLFEFMEVFYNRQRIHSAIGYLSPVAFEQRVAVPGVH